MSLRNSFFSLLSARNRVEVPDASELAQIHDLDDAELPHALLHAFRTGDIPLIEAIWRERGPFKAEVVLQDKRYWISTEEGLETLNLGTLAQDPWVEFIYSPELANRYFALMSETGIAGPEESPCIFDLLYRELGWLARELMDEQPNWQAGDLPILAGGLLHQPELALGLHELAQSRAMPKAYKHLLCWASKEEVAAFPQGLQPFMPIQYAETINPSTRMLELHRLEGADVASILPDDLRGIQLGIQPFGREASVLDWCLAGYFASLAVQHGYGVGADRILCATTTDFLSGFDPSSVDTARLDDMRTRLKSYCPVHLIHACYGSIELEEDCELTGTMGWFQGDEKSTDLWKVIVKAAADQEFARYILKLIPHDLLRKCALHRIHDLQASVREVHFLYQHLDLPASGRGILIGKEAFQYAQETGFRLRPGELVMSGDSWYLDEADSTDVRIRDYVMAQEIALGPVTLGSWSTCMSDADLVKRLFSMGTRLSKRGVEPCVHKAMALHRGLERLLPLVKTQGQWNAMLWVFGREGIKPFLREAPAAFRTKLAARTLSL
ncbi:hypothetical protein ACYPKM_01290 [Pseudomonas aeruginosa]